MDNTDGVVELEPDRDDFIDSLVEKCLVFVDFLSGNPLRPYQIPLARRIIESLLLEDAAEITALAARQSGKSEVLCNVIAAMLVLLPRLARMFPERLGKFKDGLWVGCFAPTDTQADTLYGRIVDRLSSPRAQEVFMDPEIDDVLSAKSSDLRLKRSGSRVLKMTANPRAKIESKTFHLVVVDEAQDCDDYVVSKSIKPMMADTAGTTVLTGTPNTRKGFFYVAIQKNKNRYLSKKGLRSTHYEWDWHDVVKCNPRYQKHIDQMKEHPGEDSPEFQASYCLKWMLDRGMLITEGRMEELGDTSMQRLVDSWQRTPVVVGIDVGKTLDSTVVTVVFVDWDQPDAFGFYQHRVLNWLELQGADYESQYFQIVRFLDPYNILAVAIDSNGTGAAVAERLSILLRNKQCDVYGMPMDQASQTKRWKHLMTLMDRGMIGWPAGAKVRRLRTWQRFQKQMTDAEKKFVGPQIKIAAPEEAGAHDDYVDSLALACAMTLEMSVPEVEVTAAPWYS